MDNKRTRDKNPYDRHGEKVTEKAFKSVERGVKPVAKDTNKTRRKETRARKVGATNKLERPVVNLKKMVKKGNMGKC
jgi:hypothetical protein